MKYIIGILRLIAVVIIAAYSTIIGFLILIFTFSTDKCVNWAVGLFSGSIFFISRVKFTYYGGESISKSPAKIYVANHSSHFDPPAMALSSPAPLYFLAKKELKYVPFIGWYIWMSGMIFIDRKNKKRSKESLRIAGEKVKSGKNLISFAEGTRSKTGELMVFRRGAFKMSLEHGIDIVPVGIHGARDVLASGEWLIKPGPISVKYGEVMNYKDYKNHSIEEYAAACREKVAELIEELKSHKGE